MDTDIFRATYKENYSIDKHNRLAKAASPEHTPTYAEIGYMSDAYRCACGYETPGYWDGADHAWADWAKHVFDDIVIGNCDHWATVDFGNGPVEVRCTKKGEHKHHECLVRMVDERPRTPIQGDRSGSNQRPAIPPQDQ